MYAFRYVLDKHPIQIASALFAVINAVAIILAAFNVHLPQPELTIPASESALVAVLGLFVASKTTNTASLDEVLLADSEDEA